MSSGLPVVSMSPHIRRGRNIRGMILIRLAALAPAAVFGVVQFGARALVLLLVGVLGAVATEAVLCAITRKPLSTGDFHAVLVGLVLAMMVPAGAPWWVVLVGAVMAILVGKAPFGPLGGSPIHPALVGLLIIAISWPETLTRYVQPLTAGPAMAEVPAESPINAVAIDPSDAADYATSALFLGDQVGDIGTISPLLLLLGGVFLLLRRAIRWHAPAGFLLGLGLAAWVVHAIEPGAYAPASFHLLTGVAFFGAFFLCTDFTSTPMAPWGAFVFGLSAGVLALIFRSTGGLESQRVAYAITIVSLLTPLLDRLATTPFGKGVRHA